MSYKNPESLIGKRVVCISKEPLTPNFTGTCCTKIEYGDEGYVTEVCQHSHGYGYSVVVEVTKGSHPPVKFISAIGGDIVKTRLYQFKTLFEVSKPELIRIRKWKPPYNGIEVLFLNLDKFYTIQGGEPTCRAFSLNDSHSECVISHDRLTTIKKEDEDKVLETLHVLTSYPYNYYLKLDSQTRKNFEKQGINVSQITDLLNQKRVIINP